MFSELNRPMRLLAMTYFRLQVNLAMTYFRLQVSLAMTYFRLQVSLYDLHRTDVDERFFSSNARR